MGKSSSGKDTLYRSLLRDASLPLRRVVPYTTRPQRDGEEDGREYYFTSEPMFRAMEKAGKVVEKRVYETCCGPWYYYTADDGQIDLAAGSFLLIGTPASYRSLCAFYGRGRVVPLLIEVDDGERLARALRRERRQERPRYEEMCRRFLADQQDFSEAKLQEAGISVRFENAELRRCEAQVKKYIRSLLRLPQPKEKEAQEPERQERAQSSDRRRHRPRRSGASSAPNGANGV